MGQVFLEGKLQQEVKQSSFVMILKKTAKYGNGLGTEQKWKQERGRADRNKANGWRTRGDYLAYSKDR